jgi:hypothetical protein
VLIHAGVIWFFWLGLERFWLVLVRDGPCWNDSGWFWSMLVGAGMILVGSIWHAGVIAVGSGPSCVILVGSGPCWPALE